MESNQVEILDEQKEQKEQKENTEQTKQTEQSEQKEENQEKFQDSEKDKLNKMEIIQFYSYPKKYSQNNNNFIFIILLILFLSISFFLCIFYYINNKNNEDKNFNFLTFDDKKAENKIGIKKEIEKKQEIKPQNKDENIQNKENKIINKDNKINIQKKIGIGFLYPSITEFMIITAENFLKLKKYNLYFLTKSKLENEYKYNSNISRINVYYDRKIIENTIKNENIKYLILNEVFDEKEINWLKTLNIKLIGVFDDIYISKTFKNNRNLKIIGLYDVFIQDSIEDFDKYKKNNIKIFLFQIFITHKK